jgi:hypothetical protein
MTSKDRELIRSAIALLQKLAPEGEPQAVDSIPAHCPVAVFARRFLVLDPDSDVTSEELLCFFNEIAASGGLAPLSRSQFLRRLPEVLETTFDVRKAHNIQRDGHQLRGFRGVCFRLDG